MTGHIAVACCSDPAYAPHSTAMLLSAVERTPDLPFRIYYLRGPEFGDELQRTISGVFAPYRERVRLTFPLVPAEWTEGLPLFDHMKAGSLPPVMWYRVFLPHLAPEEGKILYLDSDTLVLDHLGPLWRTDLAGRPLAAVTNPFFGRDSVNTSWPLKLGLPSMEAYFNTGVMLLNLDHFREHRVADRIVEHGRRNAGFIRFGDQDSMNALLHADRVPLSPRWNLMRTIMLSNLSAHVFDRDDLEAACRRPGVIHFEGTIKPWVDPSRHPFGREYLKVARRLPWPSISRRANLRDLENFFLRQRWLRMYSRTHRLRSKLAGKPSR